MAVLALLEDTENRESFQRPEPHDDPSLMSRCGLPRNVVRFVDLAPNLERKTRCNHASQPQ